VIIAQLSGGNEPEVVGTASDDHLCQQVIDALPTEPTRQLESLVNTTQVQVRRYRRQLVNHYFGLRFLYGDKYLVFIQGHSSARRGRGRLDRHHLVWMLSGTCPGLSSRQQYRDSSNCSSSSGQENPHHSLLFYSAFRLDLCRRCNFIAILEKKATDP